MLDKFLPPTDNLYKFTAISGLMLFVLSFAPFYFSFTLNKIMIENTRDVKINTIETENKISNLEFRLKNAKDVSERLHELNKLPQQNTEKEAVEQILNELLEGEFLNAPLDVKRIKAVKKSSDELEQLNKEIADAKIKAAALAADSEVIYSYNSYIASLKSVALIIFILGIALTGFGFSAWYKKVQKLNDLILANQVPNKEKEEN